MQLHLNDHQLRLTTFPPAMAYHPAGANLQNERVNLDPWSPQTQH